MSGDVLKYDSTRGIYLINWCLGGKWWTDVYLVRVVEE